MESINALRTYVDGNSYINEVTASCICSLLDGIEREVKCERTAAYNAGYDAGFVDDNYDADATAQHEDAMAERGWVRLPVDAGGVPIHVGDVLTDGEYTFVVDELAAFGDGSWSIRNEDGNAWAACDVTHHRAPTIEDVLREFAEKVTDSQIPGVHPTYEETIAEYAAKLRLAGDE